jgi:hypothetical protein
VLRTLAWFEENPYVLEPGPAEVGTG